MCNCSRVDWEPRVLPLIPSLPVLTAAFRTLVTRVSRSGFVVLGAAALAVAAWMASTPIQAQTQAQSQAQNIAPASWHRQFPLNGFQETLVDFSEILSGGPPRDGIPAIDSPKFATVAEQSDVLAPTEPVVSLSHNGVARAYPLRVLTWHEIANDTIGGLPVAVTFCPLCNTAIVFERRVGARPPPSALAASCATQIW